MTKLQIGLLTKRYPSGAGCHAISLAVQTGEMLAIIGPSGCGKSTLLRTIAGLERPDEGQVLLNGRDITRLRPEQRSVAMLFQQPLLFPHLNAAENAGFALRLQGAPRGEVAEKVGEMLGLVGLEGLGDRHPHQLSGGQQQRVALARALLARPQVLLLDEPFSALDAPLRTEMRQLLRRLQQQLSLTVLFVTHDQEEASLLGDRVALMHDGRLAQVGTAPDLYYRPASANVARFFGETSLVQGSVLSGLFISQVGLHRTEGSRDGAALGVIRPEQVTLLPRAVNELQAKVTGVAFSNGHLRVQLQAGAHTLTSRLTGRPGFDIAVGQTISYRIQGPVWCVKAPDAQPLGHAI